MPRLSIAAVLALPGLLAACDGPRQVDAAPPTVTYAYDGRRDFDEIERRADRHCYENYGLRAYLVDDRPAGHGHEATFACE